MVKSNPGLVLLIYVSVNQSKHIRIAPYVGSESLARKYESRNTDYSGLPVDIIIVANTMQIHNANT